jgi:hypothetical protein
MGLTPLMLFTSVLLVVRNQRTLAAWDARQEENQHRAAKGLPRRPAGAAARPSPASPQHRHRHGGTRGTTAVANTPAPGPAATTTAPCRKPAELEHKATMRTRNAHNTTAARPRQQNAGTSDPNVNIDLTET